MKEQLPARRLILAIDDDDTMHLMLHHILFQEGFDVLKASSGIEGIEIIKTRRPELVFLDVMMPGMDGFECLQAIRAIPGMELLPIVMLTGVDDIDSINRSFQLGATDYISKPINWPVLPHRIRYLLRASSALNLRYCRHCLSVLIKHIPDSRDTVKVAKPLSKLWRNRSISESMKFFWILISASRYILETISMQTASSKTPDLQ